MSVCGLNFPHIVAIQRGEELLGTMARGRTHSPPILDCHLPIFIDPPTCDALLYLKQLGG